MNRGRDKNAEKEDDVVGHIRSESFCALGGERVSTGVTVIGGGPTGWLL